MAVSEAVPYAKGVLHGVYDSVLGIITFFKPIYHKQDSNYTASGRETEEINVNRSKRRLRQTTSTQKSQRQRFYNSSLFLFKKGVRKIYSLWLLRLFNVWNFENTHSLTMRQVHMQGNKQLMGSTHTQLGVLGHFWKMGSFRELDN